MNFKDNYIFNQLKHNPKHYINNILPNDLIFTLLWYFVSDSSYAQRISTFDNIFGGKSSPFDRFFLIWLFKIKLCMRLLRLSPNFSSIRAFA